jgi:hypothetical protein
MSIRDENGKLAITPGAWRYGVNGYVETDMIGIANVRCQIGKDNSLADAALIAEAGTVTNETGRTPAELRDLCRELRAALSAIQARATDHPCFMAESFARRDMDAICDEGGDCCDWTMVAIEATDALAKSEGI